MFVRPGIIKKILKTRSPLVSKENIKKLSRRPPPSEARPYNITETQTEHQSPEDYNKTVAQIFETFRGFKEKNNTYYGSMCNHTTTHHTRTTDQ